MLLSVCIAEIENRTLNGLECMGCLAVNGTCANLLSVVKCKGQQDRCAHTSGLLQGAFLTTYELKGCVSDFICRNPNNALGFYGINPTIGFYCCKDNLCNLVSRNFTKPDPTASPSSDPTQNMLHEVQPLNCNQCSGMSGTCIFESSTCKLGTTVCRTTSSTQIDGGMTKKQISNSCGPCSDPVSFNCGSVVVSQSSNCCDTDLCNTQVDTAPLNDTANGLQCRGCFSNSSDSCRDSEQTVKCVGAENRCMNVSGITDRLPGFTFFGKGCVSAQICQAVDSMIEFRMRFNELPTCCKGDFCNGDPEIGTSTPEPVITKSPVTPEISSKGPADSKGNVGCIVGSVIGVIVGFLIMVGVCCLCHKYKRESGPV
ncbi:hypothetical protein scyTo_0017948 [Scyliorhinus torazame]|uniref:UPAR/Ly6 domain-containing protein n=1 Tax=Scyliorhinus torazame TaxID=75743 RepID=A0A401Q301_SCYTO|nr:hypothetical protein [Scyliorhinus torazame]